jgi:hypothetical protein
MVPSISHVLRTWINSRHLIQANAHQAAEFQDRHAAVAAVVTGLNQKAAMRAYRIPVETEGEKEELDRIENAHVHAGFGPCLDMIQRRPA